MKMRIYFNTETRTIYITDGTTVKVPEARNGYYDGVDLCSENAAEELRVQFNKEAEAGEMNDFSQIYTEDVFDFEEVEEEIEEAECVFRETELRYAIIDNTGNDVFTEILPEETSEEKAYIAVRDSWGDLTKYDKKRRESFELAVVELDDEGEVDYDAGYDTLLDLVEEEEKPVGEQLYELYLESRMSKNCSGRSVACYEHFLTKVSDEQLADIIDEGAEWVPEELEEACNRLELEDGFDDPDSIPDMLRERGESGWL